MLAHTARKQTLHFFSMHFRIQRKAFISNPYARESNIVTHAYEKFMF